MYRSSKALFFLFLPCLLYACENKKPAPTREGIAHVYQIDGDFEEIRDALLEQISERGMVLAYRSHVAPMLLRTNKDMGYKTEPPYQEAEVVGFCKSDLSHQLLRENPHYIGYCPYSIAVYSLRDSVGLVHMSYRLPSSPASSAIQDVEGLLQELIEDSACETDSRYCPN